MSAEDWIQDIDPYDEYDDEPVTERFLHIVHVTDKAMLFEDTKGKFWLPKSQISLDLGRMTVSRPRWLKITYVD